MGNWIMDGKYGRFPVILHKEGEYITAVKSPYGPVEVFDRGVLKSERSPEMWLDEGWSITYPPVEELTEGRTDVPRLLDAVEAVLALHGVMTLLNHIDEKVKWCSLCRCPIEHCKTRQAITSALGATR